MGQPSQPVQPQAPQPTPQATPPKSISYLNDDKGNPSSIRLMSMIALWAAIGFAFIGLSPIWAQLFGLTVKLGETQGQVTLIVFSFLLAAFAPKALQKFAEAKTP